MILHYLVCDGCPEEFTSAGEVDDMLCDARHAGWSTGGHVGHFDFCPDCLERQAESAIVPSPVRRVR